MIESDFKIHHIDNFTPAEVRATGARLRDVQVETFISLQRFREYIRRRVILLENGITTGNHLAPWHPKGKAVDGYLHPKDGPVKPQEIFKGAIHAGFKGIGIYWNQKMFSLHMDLRPNFAWWAGLKDSAKGIYTWQWHTLIVDLTKIEL